MKQTILNKITALADEDFEYTFNSDFQSINELGYGCSGVLTEATVLYFEIKNMANLLKTGKRLAARVYKIYLETLRTIAKKTQGHFSCFSPESFLIIYPKDKLDATYAVDIARKIADLITKTINEVIEKHSIISFSIGIDMGNILVTKVMSDNDTDQYVWFGNAIDKAKAIAHECIKPFYVGISGTIYHHLDEDHRFIIKRIVGFKKQIEIWSTLSYQFENVKKHLYQTNILIPFEEEQP